MEAFRLCILKLAIDLGSSIYVACKVESTMQAKQTVVDCALEFICK